MARGFVDLAAMVDWYSRRVLVWRLSTTVEAGFYVEALELYRGPPTATPLV